VAAAGAVAAFFFKLDRAWLEKGREGADIWKIALREWRCRETRPESAE
jgi:hypothetical protein